MPRQDSLNDQLKTVHKLATDAGCYDAADFIRNQVEKVNELESRIKWLEQHGKDCACRECKIS